MPDLSKPLDEQAPGSDDFLADLQGNILKGHGRDHTAHIFLTFPSDVAPVLSWVRKFVADEVTSATEQRRQTQAYRRTRGAGELFASFLLSHQGYLALGVSERAIPTDPFFRASMKQHNSVGIDRINDPPVAAWEAGYQSDIHAMVLLADDDRGRLSRVVEGHLEYLRALRVSCFSEWGDKLFFDFGPPRGRLEIEHFGHQDGVSNPRMLLADIEEEKRQRGAKFWDPAAPLRLVVVEDPSGQDRFGSYMVFRKLEQNVRAFHRAKHDLSKLLSIDPDGAAALMVGRHRDGTPTIPTTTVDPNADPNDFHFASDRPPLGGVARLCPFHAHIRRTNPRGDVPAYIGGGTEESFEFERSMRIARRGITYGTRPDLYEVDPAGKPETGIGLLFMSFQGQLRQFAIQQSGSDSDVFPFNTAFTGLETVIGQPADPASVRPQPWPFYDPNDPNAVKALTMMNFVKMLGGEYFFAPSMASLRSL